MKFNFTYQQDLVHPFLLFDHLVPQIQVDQVYLQDQLDLPFQYLPVDLYLHLNLLYPVVQLLLSSLINQVVQDFHDRLGIQVIQQLLLVQLILLDPVDLLVLLYRFHQDDPAHLYKIFIKLTI